jgi:hypothetical protein
MKQIITPRGNVALPIGTQIDISKNNPLFAVAEEFSINLTVPRPPNEHIFGYRNRLASATTDLTIDAQFLFHGREQINGAVTLVSASDDEYEVLLKGSRNNFFFSNGPVMIDEIDFGTELFVPGVETPTEEQKTAEMLNTTMLDRDWICFPANVSADGITSEPCNSWDFQAGTFITAWSFAPFLRLCSAIDRLFNHFGYEISENWFTGTQERRNIVIFRMPVAMTATVEIARFFPKWSVTDFISELENYFPVTFRIDSRSKQVRIIGDDAILAGDVAGSIDAYVTGKPKITFNDTQNGYVLKYNLPADDTVNSDKDYADQVNAADYNSFYDFDAASELVRTNRSIADGMYYKPTGSGDAWTWEKVGSVAMDVRSGDGDITRETKVYPCMNEIASVSQMMTFTHVGEDPRSWLQKIFLQAPVCKSKVTAGAGYNYLSDLRLMVYRGMDAPHPDTNTIPDGYSFDHELSYPMANFVNHKMNGDQWPLNDLELRWDTAEGLRGAETIAFLDGARKITATLLMHHIELEKIDLTKVYTLQGQRVLISELVVHYGASAMVAIDATLLMAK